MDALRRLLAPTPGVPLESGPITRATTEAVLELAERLDAIERRLQHKPPHSPRFLEQVIAEGRHCAEQSEGGDSS